jgi:transcriptional regulator with XRE-family HTH domain
MSTTIGNNIRIYRENASLSQQKLADYCGIQREVISYYENGNREVSLLHLENIAECLNIELNAFLEENPREVKTDLAFAFRANELSTEDMQQILRFKKIVKNYVKMNRIN